MSVINAAAVRRYLLGTATDGESAALERQYLGDESVLEAIAALEDALIEDYLDGRLDPAAHEQFERHYLASPRHRARVEAVRRLTPAPRRAVGSPRWAIVATAAVLAIAVAGVSWFSRRPAATASISQPTGRPPSSAPPRVFAFSVPPLAVRGAADRPSLVIPGGTDVVALDLERGDATGAVFNARVIVRTVSGDEAWSGPAVVANLAPGVMARADIPSARLAADDYTIALRTTDRDGGERDVQAYALRVRAR